MTSTPESSEPIEYIELTPESDGPGKDHVSGAGGSRVNWLWGLGAVAVLALIVGSWFLSSDQGTDDPDELVLPGIETPVPVTPTPVPTPRPVTLRNTAGSDVGAQLAALDLPGYLIAALDQRPLAFDLSTGETIAAPEVTGLSSKPGEVSTAGIVCCGALPGFGNGLPGLGPSWSYVPWSGQAGDTRPINLAEDEFVPFVLCCEPGPILASATGSWVVEQHEVNGELVEGRAYELSALITMRNLETGEQRPLIDQDAPFAWSDLEAIDWPWFDTVPFAQPNLFWTGPSSPELVAGADGTVYHWSWENDWEAVGLGEVVQTFPNAVMVDVCAGPEGSCEREIRTADGLRRAQVGPETQLLLTSSASPDGRFFAGISRPDDGGLPQLRIDPLNESTVLVPGELAQPWFVSLDAGGYRVGSASLPEHVWIGDSHVLVYGPAFEVPVLVNVLSSEQQPLDFLVRAAGNQPGFVWLPELAGVGS